MGWFRRPAEREESAPGGRSALLAEPTVLELRIHGVNNTPPHAMLEVAPGDVEQVRGDSLGSFWEPTASALAHARAVPPTHHDHQPIGVHREAYSWGPMNRTLVRLPGNVGRGAASAVSRAGWMALLPFGLANVAYWSRAIPGPGGRGRGARSVRVFGLGLSLLLVATVASVALDLLATQCVVDVPDPAAGAEPARVVCGAVPGWLGWLGGLGWSQRLAVLSLVPAAALLFLQWLAATSRSRYEETTSQPLPSVGAAVTDAGALPRRPARRTRAARAAATPDTRVPVLARAGLWSRVALARSMAHLHVAAGLALVVLTVAWTQVYAGWPTCYDLQGYLTDPGCRPGTSGAFGDRAVFAVLLVASVVVLALTVGRVAAARAEGMPGAAPSVLAAGAGRPPAPRAATRGSRTLLGSAVLLYLATFVALLGPGAPADQPDGAMLGLTATPGLVVAVLLGIALAGLGWRRAALSLVWVGAALVAAVALAVDALAGPADSGWLGLDPALVAIAALAALVLVSVRPLARRAPAHRSWREQGWAGAAPGVLLLLALGAATLLSALLVVAIGDWLNGPAPAGCLAPGLEGAAARRCAAQTSAEGAANLVVPAEYAEFAVVSIAVVALVLLAGLAIAAVAAARSWWAGPGPGLGPADPGAPETVAAAAAADAVVVHPAGRLSDLAARADLASGVAGTRRVAALTHRAELVVGALAIGVALVLAATLVVGVDDSARLRVPTALVGVGLWGMAILWGLVVARVVLAADDARGRPLALVWDLVCFLPRSAHPFGPPCYAERAVPEIAARMDAWLRGDDLPRGPAGMTEADRGRAARRRVVLSAHSQGAVLAVAALLTADTAALGGGPGRTGRVALVTYGCQLRPYFGRFFPELLGPSVLGTCPCGRTAVLATDPWGREVAAPPDPAVPGLASEDDSLVRRLGGHGDHPPAWVNLWRRTDPLGFPAASFGPNVIDRGAEEIDPTGYVARIGTHSGYPRTSAYRRAVAEALARLG